MSDTKKTCKNTNGKNQESIKKKLTDKEKVFLNTYLTHKDHKFNATQSYIHAGYSENGARQNAYRLIAKDYMRDEIKKYTEDIDIEQVRKSKQNQYNKANSNMADYIKIVEGGGLELTPFTNLDRQQTACIKKIKNKSKIIENDDGSSVRFDDIEIELYDASDSDKTTLKINGEFTDKVDITSDGEKITDINVTIKGVAVEN